MKPATTTLLLVVAATLAVYIWQGKQPEQVQQLRAESQQDTRIDTTTLGDTLAYFSSALGEATMEDIEKNVMNFARQQGETILDEELFARFQEYKKALMTIDPGYQTTSLSLDELWSLHDKLIAMQARYFSIEEQESLFGAENRERTQSLEKMAIREQFDDEEAFHQAWEDELFQHSPEDAAAYRRQTLLSRLNKNATGDTQDTHLTRVELVGEQAAERLRILDEETARFEETLDAYLQARVDILDNLSLSDAEKEDLVLALRSQYFDESEHRRIKALENIRDH
ncbi:hypothetical protein NF212_11075 [Parasalinivibrio latis]|uniref:lipase secretion chaperone n=1 Tax=Parasalinivibrio latis TaxID=2952610 RepID=UPI0030E19745